MILAGLSSSYSATEKRRSRKRSIPVKSLFHTIPPSNNYKIEPCRKGLFSYEDISRCTPCFSLHIQKGGSHARQFTDIPTPPKSARHIFSLQSSSSISKVCHSIFWTPNLNLVKHYWWTTSSDFNLRVQTDGTLTARAAVIQTCKDAVRDLDILSREFTKEYELRKMVGNGARADDKNANAKWKASQKKFLIVGLWFTQRGVRRTLWNPFKTSMSRDLFFFLG